MGIKKVWVEEDCTSCGVCESLCPEVFEITDVSHAKEGVNYSDYESEIRESADSCPVEVIKFEED
ncbi:MAG: ferredoxin [Paludibacter sp.]|jgi:ferredoxin|nr:ferredoxin [Paludibacter sp.]